MKLRPYQQDVVKQVSDSFRAGNQGVIMQMCTGAGKTATAAYIVDKYDQTKRTVLWLVHREELLLQASMTFAIYEIVHALVAAAKTKRKCQVEHFRDMSKVYLKDGATVIIASVQTMVRRLEQYKDIEPALIVADECHLSLNKTFRTIIGHFPKARLLGLTATPTREDKQSFARSEGGLYDDMICGPQMYDLIEAGMLADYDLYSPPVRMKINAKPKMKKGDFDPKGLQSEYDNSPDVFGDVIEHYKRYSIGKPAIGFLPTIKVAQDFTDKFVDAGFNFKMLEGSTDSTERWRMLKDLATGAIDGIMSVDILIEGTDVPLATTAICLRRTKSTRIYLQSIGRVLRPHSNKDKAVILDFVGLTQAHGLPDDHREWSLYAPMKRRSRPKKTEEDDGITRIQTCPECYKSHEPAPVCPNCGHEYTASEKKIKIVEGDLIKIERREKIEREQAQAMEKRTKRFEESQCNSLEDLVNLAKKRGYKFAEKWAERRYQLRVRRQKA